jgi:Protein of unknown function (DUF1631)
MTMPDDQPSAHDTAIYQACLAEAAEAGRALMKGMVAAARQSLQMRDNAARDYHERNALSHALHLLGKNEAKLADGYPVALEKAFAEAASGRAKPASTTMSLSFDQLELMDESQVQDRVEKARAQQVVLHAADQELAELNTLICAAQGLKTVHPERNPLRPEVYVDALQDVIEQTQVTASTRQAWMQHMCDALSKELAGTYTHVAQKLRAGGIRGASYAVLQTPDASANAAAARAATAQAHGGHDGPQGQDGHGAAFSDEEEGRQLEAELDELLTVAKLRQLLAGELDQTRLPTQGAARRGGAGGSSLAAAAAAALAASGRGAAQGPTGRPSGVQPVPVRSPAPRARPAAAPDFDHTVPAALDALEEMNKVDEAMQRLAERQAADDSGRPPTDRETVRGQLRHDARGVGQVLGLEVVGLMVENIANDPRLLAPVRKAVRDMEPALMRLAMIDPRFFSDKEHPARRLLDEVTQRSLAYDTEAATGFGEFLRPLQIAVDQLATSAIDSASPFESALQALGQLWGDTERGERDQREQAVRALLQAEQRNLLAEKLRNDILSWPDAARAPTEVMDFVCGPWVQVMAQARLGDRAGSGDPGGYAGLVPSLLWSAQPTLARNNISKLTKLIPALLSKLREGLKTIDYPLTRANPFFEKLISLHQQAFEPAAAAATKVREASIPSPAPTIVQSLEPPAPWLAPSEAKQSGFMEMPEFKASVAAVQLDSRLDSMSGVPLSEAGIAIGAWVELLNENQWMRTQLTWSSPHGTLFLFTNAAGGTQSMTRRLLDTLLSEGKLRVVATQHVIDGALDAVAQTAMRNSVDTKT